MSGLGFRVGFVENHGHVDVSRSLLRYASAWQFSVGTLFQCSPRNIDIKDPVWESGCST